MQADMEYDGQKITWTGHGTYPATSGMEGHQTPSEACRPDAGPIPEGNYKIYLASQGTAQDGGHCALKPAWGVQSIPRGAAAGKCEPYWANWGHNRTRLEPADIATKLRCQPTMRGGFYLHDSTKGYSHGCIEVDPSIFPALRAHHTATKKTSLLLKVAYVAERSTNGGTKKA